MGHRGPEIVGFVPSVLRSVLDIDAQYAPLPACENEGKSHIPVIADNKTNPWLRFVKYTAEQSCHCRDFDAPAFHDTQIEHAEDKSAFPQQISNIVIVWQINIRGFLDASE